MQKKSRNPEVSFSEGDGHPDSSTEEKESFRLKFKNVLHLDMNQFYYEDANFCETSDNWESSDFSLSQFDRQLRSDWDLAQENGQFRYKLEIEDTKIIGKKQYVAQLNIKRATERRKPDEIDTLQKPFNPASFNFTKVKEGEILFEMKKKARSLGQNKTAQNGEEKQVRNLVIINVSPLEYGHVLLVPDVDGCHPQVLTKDAIHWAIETMLLSKHRGFRIGFNSLCAYASVNHQHLHAFYLDTEVFSESVPVEHIHGCLYALTATPANGFAFQLHGSDIETITRWIYLLTNHLQTNEIAHNLYMTRGPVFNCERNSVNRTVRIYVWPRRKVTGLKDNSAFNVALVELAGHLPVKNRELFYELDETKIEDEFRQYACGDDEYEQIKMDVRKLAQNMDHI